MSEQQKGEEEVRVFEEFVRAAGLPIDIASIHKCFPPRPDIRCRYHSGKWSYFELTELCDESIAKLEVRPGGDLTERFWSTDATERIVSKKLQKHYPVRCPVELLCYKQGRLATPDTDIVALINIIVSGQPGPFTRVWFFGERLAQMVWAKEDETLKL